jgi:hypothetical protein
MISTARILFFGLLVGAALALFGLGRTAGPAPPPAAMPQAPPVVAPPRPAPRPDRAVYLAGRLSDEALMALAALVAPRREAVLLIDSP